MKPCTKANDEAVVYDASVPTKAVAIRSHVPDSVGGKKRLDSGPHLMVVDSAFGDQAKRLESSNGCGSGGTPSGGEYVPGRGCGHRSDNTLQQVIDGHVEPQFVAIGEIVCLERIQEVGKQQAVDVVSLLRSIWILKL